MLNSHRAFGEGSCRPPDPAVFGHAKRAIASGESGGGEACSAPLHCSARTAVLPFGDTRPMNPVGSPHPPPTGLFFCPRHVRRLNRVYTIFMRIFSLLFAAIALVMLGVFVIYVVRGPVDPVIAGGIFVSFLACLAPALLLLKPFEPPEELRRRREEFQREREERRRSSDDPPRSSGS
jgi:hypothetical protein